MSFGRVLIYALAFIVLTLLTQVGGVIFIVAVLIAHWLTPRTLQGWRRAALTTVIFVVLYQGLSATVVPALAAIGGRVPLPCYTETGHSFAAGSRLYCILNRNYVDARLVALLTEMSRAIDRAYPGTITLYLDGNFPFVDGFPTRPTTSTTPPAGRGTIRRIGWLGYLVLLSAEESGANEVAKVARPALRA